MHYCLRCVDDRNAMDAGDNATRDTDSGMHHFVQFIDFAILNTVFAKGVAL